jgi:thiamine biosynthesis lipoprotein
MRYGRGTGKIDRRRFLKYCAALGCGAVAGGTVQSLFDVMRIGNRMFKVSDSRVRMGTYVTMTAVHESWAQAEDAIAIGFEEIDRLVGILSRHDPMTPLSVMNRNGSVTAPPPELAEVVHRSLEFNAQTAGAFDVTVAPLVELFRREGAAVNDVDIQETLELIGPGVVDINAREIRMTRAGSGVTLDGIAKGFIVDRASDALATAGVANHLINAGGDIRTRGSRSDGKPWSIAIEDPDKSGNYRSMVRLANGAVATSGNYEVFYDRERLFHHVIDPHTGRSPQHSTSVSVVAESVMRADALSTAAFVMEPNAGMQMIDSLPGCECLMINRDGRQRCTRHWRALAERRSA